MLHKTKTLLSLLFCAALLQACANPLPTIRAERILIPQALLTCPEEPTSGIINTQRDVALYIEDLRLFGRACKSQLDSIRTYQNTQRQ